MLPDQEPPKNGLHHWTLKRTANAVSNGVSIREYACPLAIAGLVCALCRAITLFSSNVADYITSTATLHIPLMTMPKRRI